GLGAEPALLVGRYLVAIAVRPKLDEGLLRQQVNERVEPRVEDPHAVFVQRHGPKGGRHPLLAKLVGETRAWFARLDELGELSCQFVGAVTDAAQLDEVAKELARVFAGRVDDERRPLGVVSPRRKSVDRVGEFRWHLPPTRCGWVR